MATQATQKKEMKMEQVFALWKRTSKAGNTYFTGQDAYGLNLRGFFNTNKKNPKEPDLRVYAVEDSETLSKEEYISLWCNVSKNGNKFLTGKMGGKRVVGFIRKSDNDKAPYVTVYFSEEKKQTEIEGQQTIEKTVDPI